jgi:hypothetical protein
MRALITGALMLTAFTLSSQTTLRDSTVCFSIAEATEIANKLAALKICREDVANKAVLIAAYAEQSSLMKPQLITQQQEIERLTQIVNDCEANERALKRKRIWWGVGGVVVGALTYSYLTR